MTGQSIYWHDYETSGVNPALDRPFQFAGVRTDEALEIIDHPVSIYCQPSIDVLPQPEACLITGITPQLAKSKGMTEADFIEKIHEQLAYPGTCGAGYNSLRFDDEVTRYTLYRNFYDPYAREWQNQCSRWDIIDVVRMVYALRPDGIEWPKNEKGDPSFKLEHLTKVNGIFHGEAHEALSDVYATIELARLIKKVQPKLFSWLYNLRSKHQVMDLIDVRQGKPIAHTSRMYPAANGCTSLVLPLGFEARNKSSVLVYDLRVDPDAFLTMDENELAMRLFTKTDDLPEGSSRLPVKSLKINKCPAIAPVSAITENVAQRIHLDLDACAQHRKAIMANMGFFDRVASAFSSRTFPISDDVDTALYDGFFQENDRKVMQRIQKSTPDQLQQESFSFSDPRLPDLLFRYRARNWPDSLNAEEQQQWQEHCESSYHQPERGLDAYFEKIEQLRQGDGVNPISTNQLEILLQLEQWGDEIVSLA